MKSILDEKVVELKFDNGQFEVGVKESLSTLDKLKNALSKGISSDALKGMTKAANNIDLSGLSNGIDAIQKRFSTLGIAGMRVIENITDSLTGGLANGIRSVTDSIIGGGIRRAQNIENAHFQLQGLIGDEKEVQAIMKQANESVDQTAYSYDVAAKAASMFAATGIRSGKQMELALKGIAGVTAMTNSDYERVSELFTTIAGKGKVQAMELNRFANLGLNAAATITDYMNKVNSADIEATDSITKYIKELTGGLQITESDLRDFVKDGAISFELFSEAMGTTFGDHAKRANQTFTGAMANIRAALARTGALFFSPLIEQNGPFVEFFNAIRIKVNEFNKALGATNGMAKQFTTWVNGIVSSMTKVVEGFKVANTYTRSFGDGVEKVFESSDYTIQKWGDGTEQVIRKKVYTPFSALRDIVHSIVNIFKIIGTAITPIGEAFKETFTFDSRPLYEALERFQHLTSRFKISEDSLTNIHDAFKGFFDIIKTGIGLITRLVGAISPFGIIVEDLGTDFLELAGNVGRTLSDFSEMINTSETLDVVFEKIREVVLTMTADFRLFVSVIKGFISDHLSGLVDSITNVTLPLEIFKNILSGISTVGATVFGGILSIVERIKKAFAPIVEVLKPLFELIVESMESTIRRIGPVKAFFEFVNGVFLSGLLYYLKELSKSVFFTYLYGNDTSPFGKVASKLAKDLNELVKVIDAKALKEVAIAIAILVGSMYALAALDTDKLVTSMSAITVLLAEAIAAMKLLTMMTADSGDIKTAFSGVLDAYKIDALAGVLMKMAAAVLILSFAVKSLGSMDPDQIVKGLIAITVLLAELTGVLAIVNKMGGPSNISEIGIGLIFVAAAVAIMGKSVKALGEVDMETLVKGLVSITILLSEMLIFTKVVGGAANLDTIGAGLLFISGAIAIMALSIKALASLDVLEIAQGLVSIGALLLGLGIFVKATSGADIMATSVGLVLISGSLFILSKAMQGLATLNWDDIGRALAAIAGSLLILCTAVEELDYMGAKEGILAILELAALVAILKTPLAETLERLSKMSWDGILKAVVVIGAVLYELTYFMRQLKDIGRWGTAGGIGALATFVQILKKPLSDTLEKLSKIPWFAMLTTVYGMGAVIAELVGTMYIFTKFNLKMMAKAFAGVLMLGLMSLELIPIGNTMQKIGSLGLEGVISGLIGLAGALLIMVGFMYAAGAAWDTGIPEIGAACLLVCALSMLPIASAMKTLGSMDWTAIGHSCAALGGALLVLIAAMYIAGMGNIATIAGAVAIRIVAGALPLIADGMSTLTNINWESVGAACEKLAKSLIILIAASFLMKFVGDINYDKIKESISKLILTLMYIGVATSLISGITNTNWPAVYMGLKDLMKSILLLQVVTNIMGPVALMGLSSVTVLRIFAGLFLGAIENLVAALDVIKGFEAGDNFLSALKNVGAGIVVLGLSLKAFGPLSFIGAAAMKDLATAVVILVPALKELVLMDPEKIGSTMTSLGQSMASFGSAMKSFGLLSGIGAHSMLELSEAVANLAPALQMMNEIPLNNLKDMLTALGEAFKSFGEALNATPFWGSTMRAKGIGALIDNITKLTEVLPPFMELNAMKARASLSILGTAFKDFGVALRSTPFWDSKGRAGGIGALIENIPKLTETLPGFMKLDANSVKSSLDVLGQAFSTFGTSLNTAPFWGVADRGEAIATLIKSIRDLSYGVKLFDAVSEATNISDTLTTISGAFSSFGKAIHDAPLFGAESGSEGIATLVDSITNLANGVKSFIDLNTDSRTLKQILDRISDAFYDFGDALDGAPFWGIGSEANANAVSTLINNVGALVPAIKKFMELGDASGIKTVMGSIGDALVSLGESIKKTPFWGTEERATALVNVANAIDTLANVLVKIHNNLNAGEVSTTLGMMAGAIRMFGGALEEYGPMAETNSQAFSVLVNGMSAIASVNPETFLADIQALKELVEVIKGMTTIDPTTMDSFADALTNLSDNAITGFISAFSTDSATATGAVTEFINDVCVIIQSRNEDIHGYGAVTAEEWLKGIATKYSMAEATAKEIARRVIETLKTFYTLFKQVGTTSGQQYGQGLHAAAKYVIDIAKALAMDAYKNLNPKDEKGQSLFYKAGQDAGQGYVDGIRSKKGEAKKAGEEMASESQEGTKTENDSHSPSKEFYKLGSYAGQGYVNAIHEWAKEAYNAGKELAKASQTGIIDDEFNEPIIRPVVDLENVFDAANAVNQMFSSAVMSTMVKTNAASTSMVAGAANNVDEKFQNGQNPLGNSYTFNQYNTSPKALSRIEIYRDTKSLMQSYREAVERA